MSRKFFFGKKEDKAKKQKQKAKELGLSDKQFEDIRRTFTAYDQDGNGKITKSELRNIVRMLGQNMTEREVDEMMKNADSDASGAIEFEEFLPLIADKLRDQSQRDKELRDAFRAFDQNGDGFISMRELRQAMSKMGQNLTDEEVENIIRDVDKDGDGFVNYEEFTKFLVSQQ
ncbi:calmodulin-like [Babylonia areolata]|uniref:calmodulin-like n=1 Tax=Babylonia areolata TaxID=304850 RepID=UPI003FD53689